MASQSSRSGAGKENVGWSSGQWTAINAVRGDEEQESSVNDESTDSVMEGGDESEESSVKEEPADSDMEEGDEDEESSVKQEPTDSVMEDDSDSSTVTGPSDLEIAAILAGTDAATLSKGMKFLPRADGKSDVQVNVGDVSFVYGPMDLAIALKGHAKQTPVPVAPEKEEWTEDELWHAIALRLHGGCAYSDIMKKLNEYFGLARTISAVKYRLQTASAELCPAEVKRRKDKKQPPKHHLWEFIEGLPITDKQVRATLMAHGIMSSDGQMTGLANRKRGAVTPSTTVVLHADDHPGPVTASRPPPAEEGTLVVDEDDGQPESSAAAASRSRSGHLPPGEYEQLDDDAEM
ncbi:hypothetical protein MMC13_007656 [Lambiella insularis]|nr:hypothetical protein [Lambiella insularis]